MRAQIGQAMRLRSTPPRRARRGSSRHEPRRGRPPRGGALTALPFVARATVETLREFPALQRLLEGDRRTVHEDVNLGIASRSARRGSSCRRPARAGPLGRGAVEEVKDLARRGRSKQLTRTTSGRHVHDHEPGPVRVDHGHAGDQPAAGGDPRPRGRRQAAVVVTDELGNDSIAIRPICIFGMSWDHRALDGAYAAQFLAALKGRLESL
jgi:pyruvate/2-oxoglutarate dehydrogenase complex dihydrolipoamide acyltransferase (E2) component